MAHILLKPGLEHFEHYFASVWDECNCAVVWTVFSIALLWDWNENWPVQSCGHCCVFQVCWHIECIIFTASSFRIWNISTEIPSPLLALFIVMLPKAQLTSHSRMSGSRWVITSSWLSRSWKYLLYGSVYSCHLFLISSASVRPTPFLSFIVPIFAWNLTMWITTNYEKFLKRWEYQTTFFASWETSMQLKKQQLELDMGQRTAPNW